MINVIFVCLGNICRSPMAEAVFGELCKEEGLELSFRISSFGTSDCEEGNPVYYPAAQTLKKHGITEFTHRACMISLKDIKNADYVIVMDHMNMRDIVRMTGGQYGDKIFQLGYFTDGRDVDDPWYTRDFERAYSSIGAGCRAFLEYLKKEHGKALEYDRLH